MPSFRTLFASAALLLSLSTSALALSVPSDPDFYVARPELVRRNVNLNAKAPTKRDEGARVRIAKARAARKGRRDAAVKAASESNVAKRDTTPAPFTGVASTPAFAAFLKTKCSRDKMCVNAANRPPLPKHGAAVCNFNTRLCEISCNAGYILQTDGSCVFGAKACLALANGYFTNVNGVCVPHCNSNLGYIVTYNKQTGTPKCINVATDIKNCGQLNVVCPPSYNGIGKTMCVTGICTLRCPMGKFVYYTKKGKKPYCA